MNKSPLRSPNSEGVLPTAELPRFINGWILDGQYRRLSKQTINARRSVYEHLVWWLNREGLDDCRALEIKGFLYYITNGHTDPGGRYGISTLTKPVGTRTVKDTHGIFRTFFLWLVAEGYVPTSPMAMVKPPIHRPDQIQPFSEEQVHALIRAAKSSRHPKRDEALIMFMLDTGVRASEVCGLKFNDVDIVNRKAIVLGKGNKHRAIYFGRETGRALWQYVREEGIEGTSPLFVSEKGGSYTRSGLLGIRIRAKNPHFPESTAKQIGSEPPILALSRVKEYPFTRHRLSDGLSDRFESLHRHLRKSHANGRLGSGLILEGYREVATLPPSRDHASMRSNAPVQRRAIRYNPVVIRK